jgi:hypothetical protein
MTNIKLNRIVPAALIGVVLSAASFAFAAPSGTGDEGPKKNCSGEHGDKDPAARFQKADKNSDGFITKDEAGDKRWEHIKVADANNDGKISQAEMKAAHDSGKLGHHGKKPGA